MRRGERARLSRVVHWAAHCAHLVLRSVGAFPGVLWRIQRGYYVDDCGELWPVFWPDAYAHNTLFGVSSSHFHNVQEHFLFLFPTFRLCSLSPFLSFSSVPRSHTCGCLRLLTAHDSITSFSLSLFLRPLTPLFFSSLFFLLSSTPQLDLLCFAFVFCFQTTSLDHPVLPTLCNTATRFNFFFFLGFPSSALSSQFFFFFRSTLPRCSTSTSTSVYCRSDS